MREDHEPRLRRKYNIEKKIKDPYGNMFYYKRIKHKKYKYETTREYRVKLHFRPKKNIDGGFFHFANDGWLTIYKGYRWDGVSGPMIDTKNSMRPGVVHDCGYQSIRMELLPLSYKGKFDREFKIMMKQDWKPWTFLGRAWNELRGNYAFWGVDMFGSSSCIPGSQK